MSGASDVLTVVVVAQPTGEAEMMYIVVDKAERLSQVANGKILEVFRSLSQLSQAKMAVVLISTVPWYALVPMQSNVTANVVEVRCHDIRMGK